MNLELRSPNSETSLWSHAANSPTLAEAGDAVTCRSTIPAILVIDDHELFRMGLRALLNDSRPNPIALLEADCLQAGIQLYKERQAIIQLVVLDLNLPDSKGLSALRTFKSAHPASRIVALSESFDASVVEEARALGAVEVLNKASGVDAFRQLIRLAAEKSASPGVGHGSSGRIRLTARELQILDLVLQGSSNQEISLSTGLKIGTVKNHISWLLVVFGVSSRSRLISMFR